MTRSTHIVLLSALVSMVAAAGCNRGTPRGPASTPDAGTPGEDAGSTTPPPEDAGPGCTDECAPGTAPRCAGAGYQTCDRGSDGCMRWQEVVECGAGQTCEGGVCRGGDCPGGCCPRCDGVRCGAGSDGCGGTCGCESGMVCSDAATCCTPENGASACSRVLDSWCNRLVGCCTAPGAPECEEWATSITACRGYHVSSGSLDCAAPEWTSASFCAEGIDVCVGDIPLVSCSDIYSGTANLPRSCG